MKAAEIDWMELRGALVMLIIALIISGGALAASAQFSKAKNRIHQRERAQYLNARNHYHTLDQEEGLIATYLPRYVALENSGIIGREKRLDWIESLRQSARQSQVAKLRYKIDAQKPFVTGLESEIGDYRIYSSTMSINLDLLHEGDLFTLLDNFDRSVTGLYGLGDCDLRRGAAQISMQPDAVNVVAQCHLNFLTIRKSGGGQG